MVRSRQQGEHVPYPQSATTPKPHDPRGKITIVFGPKTIKPFLSTWFAPLVFLARALADKHPSLPATSLGEAILGQFSDSPHRNSEQSVHH
jgi:hypothetical protein